MRVVSLLASGTETVCALGLGEALVGRSHECDFPEWVRKLPAVSRPTFPIDGSSADIDRRVREKLRAGEPLYEIDQPLLARLAPDLIITQNHCAVCAVSPADLAPREGRDSVGVGPVASPPVPVRKTTRVPQIDDGASDARKARELVALRIGTLDGIADGLLDVARALECEQRGRALVCALRERVASVRLAVGNARRPTVVCLEWMDPAFTMGNWGPEIVDAAGGDSRLGKAGEFSTAVSWQDIAQANPDVIVVAPCGFGIERTLQEMPALISRPELVQLSAVRERCVVVADGNRFFNRSGPSAFESVELLAEVLHPKRVGATHEGAGWIRWPA